MSYEVLFQSNCSPTSCMIRNLPLVIHFIVNYLREMYAPPKSYIFIELLFENTHLLPNIYLYLSTFF